jgi:transposase-like protein
MASKGQRFNKYDPEFREMVLKEYFEGQNGGAKSLAKKYGIPFSYDRYLDTETEEA